MRAYFLLLNLGLASGASLATPQRPAADDISQNAAGRTVTVTWVRGVTTPNGYLWDLDRCTNPSGASNVQKCQTTTALQARVTAQFIDAASCTDTCGSDTCCAKTFYCDRGWWCRFRVWAVTSDMSVTIENQMLYWITRQPASSPDPITDFASFSTPNDGRHRVFSWTVRASPALAPTSPVTAPTPHRSHLLTPAHTCSHLLTPAHTCSHLSPALAACGSQIPRDNGDAIIRYRLRRTYSGGNTAIPATYDYLFDCTTTSSSHDSLNHNTAAGTSSSGCSTTSEECYPEGFGCAGDFDGTGSYSTGWTWVGATVRS